MPVLSYRYRPFHAIAEKLLKLIAPLLPGVKGKALSAPPRKILILKFGGMGEAVLARSLMERLHERNPGMEFDFLVEKRTAEMMTCGSRGRVYMYSPRVDGLSMALVTLREIRSSHYDAVLDFEQHSLLTAAFARATSIPVRVGFIPSGPSQRGQMFTHSIQLRECESMWSAFVRLGRVLDQELPEQLMTFPLHCSSESDTWFRGWWSNQVGADTKGPIIVMHIGVGPSAQYRRWPTERFVELATAIAGKRADVTIMLTGAKSEEPLIDTFRENYPGRSINASDLGGLERTAVLLRRCDLLISGDTGIMHLGAAMGTPTVGLFGPNTPVCWAPVGPRATYVYSTCQPCSPCINSYRRQIPEKCTAIQEGACMLDIAVDDVLRAARKVVDGSWLY
jgi:ADP-heptose:LPS heptosyltransferase